MSLYERNRLLQILHGNEIKRDHINRIMKDIDKEKIFSDAPTDVYDEFEFLEEKASEIWFFTNKTFEEKEKLIQEINEQNLVIIEREREKKRKTQDFITIENRIKNKRQELIDRGVIKEKIPKIKFKINLKITRYGRNMLHEAISMRDINKVKKYIKIKEYLVMKDNNGHTPHEMAIFEDFKEAIILFKKNKNTE